MNSNDTQKQIFIINQYTTASQSYPGVTFEMPPHSSLESVLEAFQSFLTGVTFVLPEGARIGLVYDDDTEKKLVEDKYGIVHGTAEACEKAPAVSTWPNTWTLSHPIGQDTIGSIIPTTSFSTTTTIGTGKKLKQKKKNGKRKNKSSSKR